MKYGIGVDNRTKEPIDGMVQEFNDEQWVNLMEMSNPCWIPLPKEKVFISFNELDRKRMEILFNNLKGSELIEPIIVEDERKGSIFLVHLVKQSIKECDYLIPIISEKSLNTQWVNQEIGFAMSVESIEIIPLVQTKIIGSLKGFIHNQLQLPY